MRIGLLGTVEAWAGSARDGVPVSLGGVRLRGLLARLAPDADRSVGTAVLVDDLWGEAPPSGAGNALQALVSRLRRAIGPELVDTEAGGYRLRIDPDAVDALRFGTLVAALPQADPAEARRRLRQALDLWRGPALADLGELPFAGPATARLTERRAVAVEECARLALGLGEVDGELDTLAAQLDAMPLRESTAALPGRGLHAAGRQADALAVLDRTAARLAGELGVDPGPELAAARLGVLRGERTPTIRSTAPRSRAALSSFVGRAGDVDRVRALLDAARLVTLTGPGGAGKTRLAREVVAGRPGRIHVAELASLTGADQLPAALLAAVVGPDLMVRIGDDAGPDTASRLRVALAGHAALLVLDNCEHLIDAVAAQAEDLLRNCPRLHVLTTSREPLGVPGEVLHPVDALAEADAVRLFTDRAAAVRPGFALTAAVTAAVTEICRRLDGQPLPIELAAARLRSMSPHEIAARLDDRFRLLTSGARTALPRHQTLRAVVDWSWELLAEPERVVARRLGVFAGGATAAAAERVGAGPPGPTPDGVFELLATLVDKSLVVAVPQTDGSPTRYRMLETIRAYAGQRLDEAGERVATVTAHARVMLELAETAEPHLRGADQLGWLARLRAEADEIDIALWRATAAEDADTAHRLVAAMTWSWLIRGLMEEAARWSEAVHPLDGRAPALARTLNTAYLALGHVAAGEIDDAKRLVDVAIALSAEADPHPVLALPNTVARPASGRSRVASTRTVVVLPDPLGPSSPSTGTVAGDEVDACQGGGRPELLDQALDLDGGFHARSVQAAPDTNLTWT